MANSPPCRHSQRLAKLRIILIPLLAFGLAAPLGCRLSMPKAIAVIPRTSGTMLWEPEHGGAQVAAAATGRRIYWNAPTREDDTGAQIALVEHVAKGNYEGLVLAPDQALALITPVRRAMARGLPIVIVGSPMSMPAGEKLTYILNDEDEAGRIAARRTAALLHGVGSVAILGVNPDITGIMTRTRSFERYLTENYPQIHIIERRLGAFNVPHEQQVAEEVLKANPQLDIIVALMWASTRGAISTIDSDPKLKHVKVIGFDPEVLAFEAESLDSLILEDTRQMGEQAVRMIDAELKGESAPLLTQLNPLLVTRENVASPQVHLVTSMDWLPDSRRADGSLIR